MYKVDYSPHLGSGGVENNIKLMGKKIKWGRREGEGKRENEEGKRVEKREGKREGKREEGKGKKRNGKG